MPNALYNQAAAALQNPLVNAFLDAVIRPGEGTGDAGGYNRSYCGHTFSRYAQHPGARYCCGHWCSDAAGAFQFLFKTWPYTWRDTQAALGLPDFSPLSQRLGAAYLLIQNRALPFIIAGDLDNAVIRARGTWPSLPGGSQQRRTWAQIRAQWAAATGGAATSPSPVPPIPDEAPAWLPTNNAMDLSSYGIGNDTLTVIVAGIVLLAVVSWVTG